MCSRRFAPCPRPRARAASVRGGRLPSGGSIMSEVRLSEVSSTPRSYQNSLYDSTPPSDRGR